jgi:rRNA maturation RNase YbeY
MLADAALRRPETCSHSQSSITVDISITDDLSTCALATTLLPGLQYDTEQLLRLALHGDPAELSLLLCSDGYINALNTKWRGVQKATDVLSFPQDDDTDIVLGDIVVSVHTAERQAAERNHSVQTEMRILLVHGLLHLLGYDHETSPEDLKEVRQSQCCQ